MRNHVNLSDHLIASQIIDLRGKKVLLDSHLATIYDLETRALNQAVKRNKQRFPEDFMFRLSEEEWEQVQKERFETQRGGRRYRPYAFTERGVMMLSSVLKDPKTAMANIEIMRVYDDIKKANDPLADERFAEVFESIKELIKERETDAPRRMFGFRSSKTIKITV